MSKEEGFVTLRVVNFDGSNEEKWRSWKEKTEDIGLLNGWENSLKTMQHPQRR